MKSTINTFLVIALLFFSCKTETDHTPAFSKEDHKAQFTKALRTHLDAVEQKDTIAMAKTLAQGTPLYFLQPQRELSTTGASFMQFHTRWFKDVTKPWSILFKILHTQVADSLGIAVVECRYEEPDRNGKPYFNRPHITYAQKLIDIQWQVILDQATSIQKSTD